MLPALFFVFMEQWHKGTLRLSVPGTASLDAQAVHEMFEAQDPVAVFARDKACLVISPATRGFPGADARESRRRLHAD